MTDLKWANGVTWVVRRHIQAALDLGRMKEISDMVAVTTDHCLIGSHAHRLRVLSPNFCRSCGDDDEGSIEQYLCRYLALPNIAPLGSAFFDELSDLSGILFFSLASKGAPTGSTLESNR